MLQPITTTKMNAFFDGKGRIPPDDEGFVRFVQVVVRLENRRAVEVLRFTCSKHRARRDGKLDEGHLHEIMVLMSEAASGGLTLTKTPPGEVHAEHRFALRRLEHIGTWQPTSTERATLRGLVNRRAHARIM
ncbi:MAG: hypothetical protein V2A73_10705 [Pseudomonadota bacterium]